MTLILIVYGDCGMINRKENVYILITLFIKIAGSINVESLEKKTDMTLMKSKHLKKQPLR